MNSEIASIRKGALGSLISMGENGIYLLINALEDDHYIMVHSEITEALGSIGKPAIQPILESFNESDANIQWGLIKALSAIGEPAIEPLTEMLKLEDDVKASNAARTLGLMVNYQAVKPLIAILRDSTNYHVRACAAEALGKIGDPESIDVLIESLNDDDIYVRKCAAVALGKIGNKKAVFPLMDLLKDKDYKVRASAAEALGKIGDRRAVAPMIEVLDSRGGGFYFSAHEVIMSAILKFRTKRTVELLIEAFKAENLAIKEPASQILSKMGNLAFAPLINALYDDDVETRYYAAQSLAQMGDKKAIVPLKRLAKDENEDPDVRRVAKSALASITQSD
ncbi:MAG: HEAT repeat domain-containing protein [Methanosarcina sp.]|nr:HEAT repeat domain-containing protein [Methanosarcina sp.]